MKKEERIDRRFLLKGVLREFSGLMKEAKRDPELMAGLVLAAADLKKRRNEEPPAAGRDPHPAPVHED